MFFFSQGLRLYLSPFRLASKSTGRTVGCVVNCVQFTLAWTITWFLLINRNVFRDTALKPLSHILYISMWQAICLAEICEVHTAGKPEASASFSPNRRLLCQTSVYKCFSPSNGFSRHPHTVTCSFVTRLPHLIKTHRAVFNPGDPQQQVPGAFKIRNVGCCCCCCFLMLWKAGFLFQNFDRNHCKVLGFSVWY